MTMLSAQPITLTGEQHQRMWGTAKSARDLGARLAKIASASGDATNGEILQLCANCALYLLETADDIERILIDAQDAAPPATASSGEAA